VSDLIVEGPILVGIEPLHDIQRAVVTHLADNLDVPVFDYVPEDADTPYVCWGTAWLANRDALNVCIDRVWFQIDCWSKYRGYAEAAGIAHRVVGLLHHIRLRIPGYDPIHVLREQTHATRDPGGPLRRMAITFVCPYVSTANPKE